MLLIDMKEITKSNLSCIWNVSKRNIQGHQVKVNVRHSLHFSLNKMLFNDNLQQQCHCRIIIDDMIDVVCLFIFFSDDATNTTNAFVVGIIKWFLVTCRDWTMLLDHNI